MIKVDNNYINDAILEITNLLGIKEKLIYDDIDELCHQGKIKECAEKIAKLLNLPIKINLRYVKPGDSEQQQFSTRSLANNQDGKSEGITAQISIPNNIPMFGTRDFENLTIDVRVSKNVKDFPQTFISVMAHEFSHIILYSLKYNKADNEIHTDLTAMILGFNDAMQAGRKIFKQDTRPDHMSINTTITTTTTTTYGYLDDNGFNFAHNRINEIIEKNINDKKKLIKKIKSARKNFLTLEKNITKFKKYLDIIDKNRERKIKKSDTKQIISFHQNDYLYEIEKFLNDNKNNKIFNTKLLKAKKHYHKDWISQIEKDLITLNSTTQKENKSIKNDLKVLNRNIGILKKIINIF